MKATEEELERRKEARLKRNKRTSALTEKRLAHAVAPKEKLSAAVSVVHKAADRKKTARKMAYKNKKTNRRR